MSRQKKLLAILVGLFILALAYAFWAMPRQDKVAATSKPLPVPRPAVEAPGEAPAGESRVRLDLLNREGERFPGYQRDIFNYPRPAPPPPPKIVKAPPPPPPMPMPTVSPAPVTPEVKRELARFTFLGYLEKDGVRTVFLSSGGEIFVVKKGESFGEKNEFHVTNLTPETLTINHREDPRAITVPLVEQAPLVPAAPARGAHPAPRPPAGFGFPGAPRGGFVPPREAPREEEVDVAPVEEGENEVPPFEENNGMPQTGEEGMTGDEVLPPGGAADE